MTIPINESVLYYLYQAVGIDPNNCSQFVSDAMGVFGAVVICLFFVGCLCLFGWFLKLCRR